MLMDAIRRWLTKAGVATAHPLAFLVVGIYTVAWFFVERETFDWHGAATLATWLMTLLIQRSEHRDTQAIQAKLDELLHAQTGARNALTHLDKAEPDDIERHRDNARKDD